MEFSAPSHAVVAALESELPPLAPVGAIALILADGSPAPWPATTLLHIFFDLGFLAK